MWTFLIVCVSGFDLEKDTTFYSSKTEAFEECEDWKDQESLVIYATSINIAEESSRFSLENPAPLSNSSGSTRDQLKYADRLYEWNQLVENFLAKHPTKATKNWQISALDYKKWSNQQNKGIFCNDMIYIWLHGSYMGYVLYKVIRNFMIWPIFRF